MLYKKIEDEAGEYVDAQGCRFTVQSARRVRTAEGVNVGYVDFPSMEDALAAWGLRVCPAEPLSTLTSGVPAA